jgi:hypothetical protein
MSFNTFIPQGGNYLSGGTTQHGAPVNVGSNARAIAELLGETSIRMKNLALTEKQKAAEVERIRAQEEFLKAKREGTLDLLRKATLSGELPEGMSPSYNDFRKVLLAKDAVTNVYQSEINSNLDVLVDPDGNPETKARILEGAYRKAGIDQYQLDPVGKDIVLKQIAGVQSNLDSLIQRKSVEVNKIKMAAALDQDAINATNSFDGDEGKFVSGVLTSVDIARRASVKEPVKEVIGTYLKQIRNHADKDPESALKMLVALETAELGDGTRVVGNVDLLAGLIKTKEAIETDMLQEDARADRLKAKQRNDIIQALEAKIPAELQTDPTSIKQVFDSFLQQQQTLPADQQLPLSILSDIRKERDSLVKQAMQLRSEDVIAEGQRLQEIEMLKQIYGQQAAAASSEEELQSITDSIQMRDYLTVKDKSEIIKQVNLTRSSFQFASTAFKDAVKLDTVFPEDTLGAFAKSIGVNQEALSTLVNEEIGPLESVYQSEFDKALKEIAKANGLTVEQALLRNKSYYVKDKESETGMSLDSSNNLVKQAISKANAVIQDKVKSRISTHLNLAITQRKTEYAYLNNKLETVNLEALRAYKNSDDLSPEDRDAARQTIVSTRAHLMRLAEAVNTPDTKLPPGMSIPMLSQEQQRSQYDALQNKLGYSVKELVRGKTFAGLDINWESIDPWSVRLVWNKKELEVLKSMPEEMVKPIVSKLKLQSKEDLIAIQEKLL